MSTIGGAKCGCTDGAGMSNKWPRMRPQKKPNTHGKWQSRLCFREIADCWLRSAGRSFGICHLTFVIFHFAPQRPFLLRELSNPFKNGECRVIRYKTAIGKRK